MYSPPNGLQELAYTDRLEAHLCYNVSHTFNCNYSIIDDIDPFSIENSGCPLQTDNIIIEMTLR